MESIVVGIDIGTTKVCTLVARLERSGRVRILGVGIEPSQGIRKGSVIDLEAAAKAITHSIDRAERTSGLEISAAVVSLAGSHVSSVSGKGVVSVSRQVVDENDVARVLEAARAVAVRHNEEVIDIIQRGFTLDGQDGIRTPIGMHGYRLEVETHIITASSSIVDNLRQCVAASGIDVYRFVLNPLASAEVVLSETEKEMGVVVCDIGGGTTDMAIYVNGDVWHTMVLAVGGNHITADLAHGLRVPFSQAEEIKLQHGEAMIENVNDIETFPVRSFGGDPSVTVKRKDLAYIIEPRVEEIFELLRREIKRSGYDGLLPAGMVLTGGTSRLPGIQGLASRTLGMPVRLAEPEGLVGMVDRLHSPQFSTSVGLLHSAVSGTPDWMEMEKERDQKTIFPGWKEVMRKLLP